MTQSSAAPQAARGRRRGFESVRDIVLSMALVGLVVLAVYWVVAWQRPEVQGPIRQDVDVAQLVSQVRGSGALPVLEPRSLPDGWEPTSAWFQPAAVSGIDGALLHIGYLTPGGSYAEVEQTDGNLSLGFDDWLTGEPQRAGEVTVGGQPWQRWETPDQTALVLHRPQGLKVVVTGKADVPELQQLAESLS